MADTDVLNALADKVADLREKETAAARAKAEVTKELESIETELLNLLVSSSLVNYRSPAGMVSIGYFTSVKTPKTPEDIQALAEYAKSVGEYENVFKPGSASVNSFYKSQLELAKEQGKEDIEIPGLKEISIEPRLSFRRSR